MAVERAVAVLLVAVALGVGAGIWLTGGGEPRRQEVGPLAAAIDWSHPDGLPPPTRAESRTEFVSNERGDRYWPRSGRVTPSQAYQFNTGHCGLSFLTDFDGSFWRPIDPGDGEPPDAFFNEDEGAIALIAFDTAVYRSARGLEIELVRLPGPVVRPGCA